MFGPIKVQEEITKRKDYNSIFSFVEDSYVSTLIAYIIHSDFRQATTLSPWIKEQVTNPDQKVVDFYKSIKLDERLSNDIKAVIILNKVISTIEYTPDQKIWSMPEYWQTAKETIELKKGDCEDGAILIYVLCRLAGIPANRLFLCAGDVLGGGHCWCAYRPEQYPLNFTFLDWCYWPQKQHIPNRPFFEIQDKQIYEYGCYDTKGESWYNNTASNYYNIWFAFSEDTSYLRFKRK
jgi:transglutaminase-like putative cysteine protease